MLESIGLMISAYKPAPQSAAVIAPGASGYLDDKASDSNELELFVAVEQGSRHDVGRGEEQVDGQELAQRP